MAWPATWFPITRPDTRFHLNFAEVIPDFEVSEAATDRLVADPAHAASAFTFITPDNRLADLRRRMIEAGKPFVMSTYGIYRGFRFPDPARVPAGAALDASWLDGMEHFGDAALRPVVGLHPPDWRSGPDREDAVGRGDYLFLGRTADTAQARLPAALAATLPITFVGMFVGLAFAFLLAISSKLFPRGLPAGRADRETMPLVALTPLLVLILGRGPSLTLWVTIPVTFFPAFVTVAQGIALVPHSADQFPKAYGAGRWREIRMVTTPAISSRPRASPSRARCLGVMFAEWLATGRGLGNLLNQSRGYLDFGMIWTVGAVSVVLSVLFYQAVVIVERRVLRLMG